MSVQAQAQPPASARDARIRALIRTAQDGDRNAERTLVEENAALIHSVVRRFCDRGVDYDDLYQMGCLGFVKAVRNFNLDYDVRFSTYAVPMMMGEIRRFLRDDGTVKVSRTIKEQARRVMAVQEALLRELGREPTLEEIAEQSGVPSEEVSFVLESLVAPMSLDGAYEGDGDNTLRPMDQLSDPGSQPERIDNQVMVRDMLVKLSERERRIIYLRYFMDRTQSEIAQDIGVSQVQISRLENKILKKLRQMM